MYSMSQWEPRAALNSDGQYRNMRRNREVRLEGFEPPTLGLGKRDDTLQWIAEVCESCIPKPFFLPRIAGIAGQCIRGGVRVVSGVSALLRSRARFCLAFLLSP